MNSLIGVILFCSIAFVLVSFTFISISVADALIFDTGLNKDGLKVDGSLATGFNLITDRNPETMYVLTLSDPTSSERLVAGYYPFSLIGSPDLTTYFHSKGWPSEWLTWIDSAIAGEKPFFYLKVANNDGETQTYSIVDAFMKDVLDTETDLRINGDYPLGTYTYTGTIYSEAGGSATINVILNVEEETTTTSTTTTIPTTTTSSTTTTSTTIPPVCNIGLIGTADFGKLNPNGVSIADQILTIANSGDATATNVQIYGTDWGTGFPVTQTRWSTTPGMDYSGMHLLNLQSPADPLSDLGPSSSLLTYFKLGVPAGQVSGSYTQDITFSWSC